MLIKKTMENYNSYVNAQDGRGSIDDSTLYYNNIIQDIFKQYNIIHDDNILDIGTRNGRFIKDLHEHGYINSYGTDISVGASSLWQRYSKELQQYFAIEDAQLSLKHFNKKYRLVTMSHVLEHMYDVDAVLNNIKEVLTDNGLVYIVVPCEDHTNHSAHYTSFPDMDDLVNLCMQHDFTIEKKWHNYSFQPELQILVKYNKNV